MEETSAGISRLPLPRRRARPATRRLLVATGVFVLVVLTTYSLFMVFGNANSRAAGNPILLEDSASLGPDPFTESVSIAAPPTTTSGPNPLEVTGVSATVATANGDVPALYAGTRDGGSCDRDQLISSLRQSPDRARSWALAEGIPLDRLPSFIQDLTSVVLRFDTRVTNNGFVDNAAVPHQSILQAGSAVLVDANGVPRTRCSCGNPLVAANTEGTTGLYAGNTWPGFDPSNVITVSRSKAPIDTFVLYDPTTRTSFGRYRGGDGTTDVNDPRNPTTLTTPDHSTARKTLGPATGRATPTTAAQPETTTTTAPTTQSSAAVPQPQYGGADAISMMQSALAACKSRGAHFTVEPNGPASATALGANMFQVTITTTLAGNSRQSFVWNVNPATGNIDAADPLADQVSQECPDHLELRL